jgi:hypothetical protein
LICDGCHEARRKSETKKLRFLAVLFPDLDTLRQQAKIAFMSNYAARSLIGDAHFDTARWTQTERDLIVLGTELHMLARPHSAFLDPEDITPWRACAHDVFRTDFYYYEHVDTPRNAMYNINNKY